MELIAGQRQSGKTTKLIEAAIEWMGENEGNVYFLGFSERWTRYIKDVIGENDLVGFRFLSAAALPRNLKGISGMLAVDNFDLFSRKQQEALLGEFGINQHLYVVATWNVT